MASGDSTRRPVEAVEHSATLTVRVAAGLLSRKPEVSRRPERRRREVITRGSKCMLLQAGAAIEELDK